ncbi:MAG: hypothetical protein NDJ89_18330 [Oligoflexia bacterium]|nr:hypothetical protein [Oligoflexia bacterium]
MRGTSAVSLVSVYLQTGLRACVAISIAGLLSSCVAKLNAPIPADAGLNTVVYQPVPSPVPPGRFSISPVTTVVPTGGATSFAPVDGTAPYTFDVYFGSGQIEPSTGAYVAPLSPGAATIRAQDALGDTAYATVEITEFPVIDPTAVTLAAGNSYRFSVKGGKGPYSFIVSSGEGSVDASGEYVAPEAAGSAVVRVSDGAGRTADAAITVEAALAIDPASVSVPVSETFDFSANGGVAPKAYSLISGSGSIDPDSGLFTAPPVPGMAAIKVKDALGNVDVAIITITNPLKISPLSLTLARNSSFTFSAAGGRPPYAFSAVTADGTIATLTGQYTAPDRTGLALVTVEDANGETDTAAITLTDSLSFSSLNVALMIGDEYTFTAQGGTPAYFFTVPSAGFSGSGATYTATALGSYIVNVSDSQFPSANAAQTLVTVNPPIAISPEAVTLAVDNSANFSASGGVAPYVYSASAGSIDASTGSFTAPAATGTVTVTVTDARGHSAQATVTVNPALAIAPATETLVVGGSRNFSASGGLPPYTFAVLSGGGAVNSSTGAYSASASPGTAIVRVQDALGNSSDASVTLVTALSISPATISLLKGSSLAFTSSGGALPYVFSLVSGGGSIDASSGLYSAPEAGGTAVARVSDAIGGTAEAAITIYDGLTISPFAKTLIVNGTASFSASGGVAPYTYSVFAGGGAIDALSGVYSAPGSAGSATIRVTDAVSNTSDAAVTIQPALAISVAQNPIAVSNSTSFSATGGLPPYVFSVRSGGGAINAGTGDFVAAVTPSTVVVRVTDSSDAYAEASLTVSSAPAISPASAQVVAGGTASFTASGGVGGNVFSVSVGGGSFAGGASPYTAPATPGAATVRVTDALGNYSEAAVTIYAPLTLSPTSKELAVGNQFSFIASGGVQPYVFSHVSGEGSITTGGTYTAPATVGTGVAAVKVRDAAGNEQSASIAIREAVSVSPPSVTLAAGAGQLFTASGGVTPYVYQVVSGGGSFSGATYSTPATASGVSVSLRVTDALGNTANATVTVPAITVAFSAPSAGSYIRNANQASFAVSGTCTEEGRQVSVSGPGGATATPSCLAGGTWSATLDLSGAAEGPVTLTADHSNSNGVASAQASLSLVKDTGIPTLTLAAPIDGSAITALNKAALVVSGTCSENTRVVSVSATGGVSASPQCVGGGYSATLDFTSVSDGAVTISANHSDAAGNAAAQVSVSLTKDTGTPTVTLTAPAAGSYIHSANYSSVTVSGSCSEDTRIVNVTTTGGLSSSPSCSSGSFSTTLDFTSVSDGVVTVSADHSDAAGNTATQATVSVTKDVVAPASIAIGAPSEGATISIANRSALTISGTCSEAGTGNVLVKAGVTSLGTADCATGAFTGSFDLTAIPDGAVALSAILSDAAGNSRTSNAVNVTLGGGASKLVLSGPVSAQAGVCSAAFTMTTQNADNTVTAVSSDVTVNLSGAGSGAFYTDDGCGSSATSVTISGGSSTKTFYFKSTVAEPLILSAEDAAAVLTASTLPFSVTTGTASKLGFTVQPSDATAGAAVSPAVKVAVQDSHGNTISGATNSITLAIGTNPSAGTLSGTLSQDAITGVATFGDLSINRSGTGYTLTASASGLTSATSSGFTISAGTATKLGFIVEPSNASPAAAISPAIQVAIQDTLGNTVPGASASIAVAIGTNPASGTLSGTSPVGTTDGVASFSNLSINNGGVGYTLVASAASLTSATSASFNIIRQSSLTASAGLVPSDGVAQASITVIPRSGTDGSLMGTGQTIEVTVSSSNVTLSGAGACRTPSATCVMATDLGGGAYGVTAVSATPGSYTFSGVIVEAADRAIIQTASVTFDTAQFTQISANTTITSAAHGGRNLYFTGGTATFDTSTVGVSFGHLFVNGGTLTHLVSSTTVLKKLDIQVASLSLQSGSINANNVGYTSGYSYGPSGPSNALSSGGYCGQSHGGKGGKVGSNSAGPTYGDYRDPSLPGGGSNYAGGGVVRIVSAGGCLIKSGATISANGVHQAVAGGSINLRCASFSGNAGAGAITANGGSNTNAYGGGGGGRIALVSSGDANSFSGIFTFPTDSAKLAAIKTVVKAVGGSGGDATTPGGGAGTIYLKHSELAYGDLIIDNGGQANYANTGSTFLVSMAGTVNGTPGSSTLPVAVTSTPALSAAYVNLYSGMRLRPDLAFTNGTASNWADDNVLTIASNSATTLTMTASFSSVASGASFRSIDILDHIDVAGSSNLQTNGDLYVLSGSISAPGSGNLALENAFVEFLGGAATNLILNTTLSSGSYSYGTLNAEALTISGATVTATNVNVTQGLTQTAGTLTANNVTIGQNYQFSGGTTTVENLAVTGNLSLSGAAVMKHPATTTTAVYRLQGTIGGSLTLGGTSSINVNGLGYPSGYSYGPTGPSTALGGDTYAGGPGGSHGGRGADNYGSELSGPTYDDYRAPFYPGGGGYYTGNGGGVVKLSVAGTCTIMSGASITANGAGTSAGGSIQLACAGFGGTAATSAVSATGSPAVFSAPGGGGGRIALISSGNASSFSGSFAYPTDATTVSNFKGIVKAKGGAPYDSNTVGGGAGTVYLKHSGLTYGDLIVDNGGNTHYTWTGRTPLVSMAGTVNGEPGTNTLPVSVSSSPGLTAAFTNLYSGMRMRPDLAFSNGTINDWSDDNVLTLASNSATVLTMTGAFGGVSNGASFRSIDILDHVEITGNSWVQSNGDLYVLNGSISSPSTTQLGVTDSVLEFFGSARMNLALNTVLSTGTLAYTTLAADTLTLAGATVTATQVNVSGSLTQTSGSFTAANVSVGQDYALSGGTASIQSLSAGGNLTLSGSAILKHPTTTTSTVYKLEATLGGSFSMSGTSTINVSGLGYPSGYSYGATGPSTALASTSYSGASHGGKGGLQNGTNGQTYGDYRDPSWPGAGGPYSAGGGAVRIVANGTCTINSGTSINANGAANGSAGGTVNLRCSAFSGSAGASAISANGTNATGSQGGGGGGRIALVSTGGAGSFSGSFAYPVDAGTLSGIKSTVKALGGASYSTTYPGGGAGTVFLKHSGLAHGDLIIDNGGQANYDRTGKTFLPSLAGTVNGVPGAATLPVSVASAPALSAAYANLYAGLRLRPDLAYTNGTASDWSDDNILTVLSNDATSLTMTGGISGVANGVSFRSIDLLDRIDVGGNALVETNGDLYVLSGGISSGSTTLTLSNSLLEFLGTAGSNLLQNATFSANSVSFTNLAAQSLTVSGATVTATNLNVTQGLSQTGGSLVATNATIAQDYALSGGTATIEYLTTGGNLALSGSAILKHPATTASTVYRLQATVGGNLSMSGTSAINVNALGYLPGYSYGSSGPSATLASSSGSGSSHGGLGGQSGVQAVGPTYGDYRNPNFPGAGTISGSNNGGGVVRIEAAGSCTINSGASITANARDIASGGGGAGGSIYLRCQSFAGTAGAAALTANGTNAYPSAGGGGGRIALISTSNAASFSGSFAYPVDASTAAAFKSVVRARGGVPYDSFKVGGGAGTVYLKHSGLTHGDLIIDNGGQTVYDKSGATFLPSLAGTVSAAPGTNALPVTVASTPSLTTDFANLYAGLRLRPDLAYTNGTPSVWSDDNVLTVASNDATALTTTGSFSGVSSGASFRSIDILDHLEISNGAFLGSNGDLYVLDGSLSAPGATTLRLDNAFLSLQGSAQTNLSVENVLTSGTYEYTTLSAPMLTLSGGTITATNLNVAQGLTVSGGTLNATTVNVGQDYVQSASTATIQNLNATGNVTLSGAAKLQHPATTSSTVYRLQATIGGNLSLSGTSSIDVSARGYTGGYSYGATGPSTALVSSTSCGASHGGRGGKTGVGTVGLTYGDYRNPNYPGSSRGTGPGGGVARLTVSGACTINSGSSILANATDDNAAGGSIYLACGSFAGTAGASAIMANGGKANSSRSGGGGGRIALISSGGVGSFSGSFTYPVDATSLTSFKSVVKALGGAHYSATYFGGGAGTIYLKHSGLTHGDLIIDNGGQATYANTGTTQLVSATDNASTVFSFPNADTAQITSASTPFANKTDLYQGHLLHVFPISGGSNDPYDASHVPATLASNGTNSLVTSGGPFPTGGADNSYLYRFVYRLDRLDIDGNAIVDLNGADLMLEASGADSCDLHSGVAGKLDVPGGSSLTGNTIASQSCSGSSVTGSVTFTNNFLTP